MLANAESHSVTDPSSIELAESHLLSLPQVECPVVHHFGPGIYIREVTIPAGTLAIGHAQRFEHLNIMLTGAVSMVDDDGNLKVLRAPLIFVGKPGRKVGVVLETCTWQNVYATEEKDIDKLEAMYLDKSETWKAQAEAANQIELASRAGDRDDFLQVIDMAGFAEKQVRHQSEFDGDQIPMPDGFGVKVTIRKSNIEGRGVFLSCQAECGEVIAPARIGGMRTPAGRFTNHSMIPNAEFFKDEAGDVWLVATKRIAGCQGGNQGEEVTVDYRQALSISGIELKEGDRQ